jgi:hypothetical protein
MVKAKIAVFLLTVMALSGVAVAQVAVQVAGTQSDVYWVSYFDYRNNNLTSYNAYDQTVRIINPGTSVAAATDATPETLCADIYVFDAMDDMVECCNCKIGPNVLLKLSVNYNLTYNPAAGGPPPALGVIKIISDSGRNCNAKAPQPTPDLRASATHLQALPTPVATGTPYNSVSQPFVIYAFTEEPFQDAPLNLVEQLNLGQGCSTIQKQGKGAGVCTCSYQASNPSAP